MSNVVPFLVDHHRRSWGRVARGRHVVARPWFRDQIPEIMRTVVGQGLTVLPYGLGRSYGDSNLNPDGALIDMAALDRFMVFDSERGTLIAEAGVSLDAILQLTVPHGWFISTTPGTRFVTLGGAIANDVHGKNHHRAGTFGCGVRQIALARSDGSFCMLSPDEGADLFNATVGGIGLTGVISWAEVQLVRIPSAWIEQETIPFAGLDEFFSLAGESVESHEHTVAWIDCTAEKVAGRGLFTRGNWSMVGDLTPHRADGLAMPIDVPSFVLNPLSLRAFNRLYHVYQTYRARKARVHYAATLYPLDAIGAWNRMYGRSGFYQYQCVLPTNSAKPALVEILQSVARLGEGSFLCVLKTFGPIRSPGLLSFPFEGATLALDFRNKGKATLDLFDRLDDIVGAARGRLYPAKDGRIPAAIFKSGYPRWQEFSSFVDPSFASSFWRRVSA